MSTQIQVRRDTAANWTSANPVLAQGELGFEIDTRRLKIGDGATAWTALQYFRAVRPVNAQTGTAYTLTLADAGQFVTMSNAGASTLTIPPNSSVGFPVGSEVEGAQLGAGQVTIVAGAGVTVNATPGLKVAAQFGTFGLKKLGTDLWLAYGRLSA